MKPEINGEQNRKAIINESKLILLYQNAMECIDKIKLKTRQNCRRVLLKIICFLLFNTPSIQKNLPFQQFHK